MQTVKKTAEYKIYQKKSGRYAVKDRKSKKLINGEAKQAVLVELELIKLPTPKAVVADPETETSSEETATA